MAYFKAYFASDNTVVSEAPSLTAPVELSLRADLNENKQVRLYVMADPGYSVSGTEVVPSGTTAAKWSLAPDSSGTPGTFGAAGAKLTLGTVGNGTGKVYFWAKAAASSDEGPVNDISVKLDLTGIASAV